MVNGEKAYGLEKWIQIPEDLSEGDGRFLSQENPTGDIRKIDGRD